MTPGSNLVIVKDEKEFQEVNLETGGVFSSVKKQADRPPHFTLKTKAAVMGVRGTHFFATYGKAPATGPANCGASTG